MQRQTYINIPVKNPKRTKEFFSALGFKFEPKFESANSCSMIISDAAYVMFLAEEFFKSFSRLAICDTATSNEVLVCLSCESRAEVDELVAKAVAAGGKVQREPQEYGAMYGQAFVDLDGHIWELGYMEPDADMHV